MSFVSLAMGVIERYARGMAAARLYLSIGSLEMGVESDHKYPDMLNDMVARMNEMLAMAILQTKAAGIDLVHCEECHEFLTPADTADDDDED